MTSPSNTAQQVLEWGMEVLDAVDGVVPVVKPQVGFFEPLGHRGWAVLEQLCAEARRRGLIVLLDAKRGDIGSTAEGYAQALLDNDGPIAADAVTLSPYMGRDSVEPFLAFEDKWTILLAATSNPGAEDFEFHGADGGQPLWRRVLEVSSTYAGADRLMYVVGATRPEWLAEVREVVPERFLLVPGVGAQGGTLEAVCAAGWAESLAGGLLVNVGRSLMYASSGEDFAEAARAEALRLQQAMAVELAASR